MIIKKFKFEYMKFLKLPYYIRIEILSYLTHEVCGNNFLSCFGRFKEDYSRKIFLIRKNIWVPYCQKFDGSGLPYGVTHLVVWTCSKFDGKELPNKITHLKVWNCPKFEALNLISSNITNLIV